MEHAAERKQVVMWECVLGHLADWGNREVSARLGHRHIEPQDLENEVKWEERNKLPDKEKSMWEHPRSEKSFRPSSCPSVREHTIESGLRRQRRRGACLWSCGIRTGIWVFSKWDGWPSLDFQLGRKSELYFGAGLIKVERELSGFLVGLVVEVVQVRGTNGNESAWFYFDRQEWGKRGCWEEPPDGCRKVEMGLEGGSQVWLWTGWACLWHSSVEPRTVWSVVRKGMVTGSCCYIRSVVQFEILELKGKRCESRINIWNLGGGGASLVMKARDHVSSSRRRGRD